MKSKAVMYTILAVSAVFIISGCGGESGKDKSSKNPGAELLNLDSVPVYAGEIPAVKEASKNGKAEKQAPESPVQVYRDDFDSFDPSFWSVVEEKTNNLVPEKAVIDNGNLIIKTEVTDRNPFFFSKPIPVSQGDIVTVKRHALVHPGNRYANITFSIRSAENNSQTLQSITGTKNICSVQYLDFQYDPGRYPVTEGVLVTIPGYKDSGEYTVWETAFDRWIDEEWRIDTGTGEVSFTLDGKTTKLQGSPVTLPFIRVYMNAYGWYTGHSVTVDYLEIDVQSKPDTPAGIKNETQIASKEMEPSEKPESLSTGTGISVELPRLASSAPEVLSISKVEFDNDEKFSGVEVTFGNKHSFDGPVRITIPVPEGAVPEGENIRDHVVPVSYNPETGEWDTEPCLYDDGSITVISDHLSLFALTRGKGITLTPIDTEIKSKEEAIEAAWSSMTSNLDWVSQGQSFASLVSDAPFLETLGNQLAGIGAGFAILDISKNIAQGNSVQAEIGTIKMISGWALGKFSTLGTQIAGIGTFFIDYSLNTLATKTLEAQYEAFEKAYDKYYRSEGKKSIIVWYKEIKEILSTSKSPEEASDRLNSLIDSHVKAIWNDEGAFEGYLAEIRGHGWAGDAGLTDEVKLKLENNYKILLGKILEPAFLKAAEHVETEAFRQQYKAAARVREALNKDIVFWIDVFNDKKDDQLDAVILSGNNPVMVAGKAGNGAVDFYAEMPLSKFLEGPKPTHVLLQGILQIDDETTVPISMKKAFNWKNTTQDIDFSIDRTKIVQEKEEAPEEASEKKVNEEKKTEKTDTHKEDDSKTDKGKDLSFIQKIKILETSDNPEEIEAILDEIKGSLKAREDDGEREYYRFFKDDSLDSKGLSLIEYLPNDDGEESFFFPSKTWMLYGIGKHGPAVTYYHDGKTVQEEAFYIHDKLSGPYKSYYKSGQLKSSGQYKDGIKTGHWAYYQSNGKIAEEGDYDSSGNKDGVWMDTDILYGLRSEEPFPIKYNHGEIVDASARSEVLNSLMEKNN